MQDFAQDDYFIQWVQSPDSESDAFWNNWIKDHPHKKGIIAEARMVIASIDFSATEPSEEDFREVKSKIDQQIQSSDHADSYNNYRNWVRVAAVALVLVISAWLIMHNGSQSDLVRHSTAYGETEHIVLPDNSIVTLNANSTLSYLDNWEQSVKREVWLEGEAFFDVKKMPHLVTRDSVAFKRFLVHSGAVNVEVLGTSFNINNRKEAPKIVLRTGKIALEIPTEEDTSKTYMYPGDFVQYVAAEQRVITKKVDPEKYTSWTDYRLYFDDTSLKEVAEIIKDNYGKQVIFESDDLEDIKLTGTVSTQNLDVFIHVISESIDKQIIAKGNTLIVKN